VAAVNTTQEDMKMAEVKEIQVGFRKTVSDGQYGNETHEARLTVTTNAGDEGVGLDEVLAALATVLEGHVNSRFRQSPSEHIRYAMETTDERKERRQQERAEREARLAAQAARDATSLFVGGDDEDDEDEDDDDDRSF
jgi:Arc/MetJ-type ribon-helix-helix transcriptional regulator